MGRPVESPRNTSKTPKGVIKAFSRKSWQTDALFRNSDRSLQPQSPSVSESDSVRASRTFGRSNLPPDSPCSSVSTIQRILAPNLLSPGTPGYSKGKISLPPSTLLLSPSDSNVKKRAPNLLGKITMANAIKDVAVPSLYKFARKCLWKDFVKCFENCPVRDITYVYKKDGTTIMHMIVMSRTGYIDAFKGGSKDCEEAPLELLEDLLYQYPDLATVRCSLNGYTPLTYACLVCNDRYDVETAATMVRLFLKYCPESLHVFTHDGLSAVDIHVVSYSHHHQDKEDSTSLGRTSASVLRTLLTHSPALANNRLDGDKIRGPIELLYKCNAKAFTEALMDVDNDWVDEEEDETITSEFTVPHRRQEVLDRVSKWWIWTWTVMILKYGSLKQKKRGSQFAAVHAAAMQLACPAPVLNIAIYTFPRQVKQSVLDKDSLDNLPLHAVCSWPLGNIHHSTTQALCVSRKSQAITKLLDEHPMAIKVTNGRGETALELAVKTGTTWEGGVRRLVKAYPKALRMQSKQTGLYPFMTAACAAEASTFGERDARALRMIYGLLRSNPKVLTIALQGDDR